MNKLIKWTVEDLKFLPEILFVVALVFFVCIAFSASAENTNQVAKVEKEKKREHFENKIIVKERDKGSTKESDWKTVKEYTLMFKNNRKSRKLAKDPKSK